MIKCGFDTSACSGQASSTTGISPGSTTGISGSASICGICEKQKLSLITDGSSSVVSTLRHALARQAQPPVSPDLRQSA
jgi:hypothetical protein